MKFVKPLSSVPAIIIMCSQAVMADEKADTTLTLGEVSVTAIKQSLDIGSLPVSSTVVGEKELQKLNVVTMKGISEVAPNFYIPDYGSRMTSSIYVRGIGARIDQPVIGLNVDNVPYLNKDNYDFDLVDIERIEMLRGPQSTLFGRNTMGGLVNIYTLSPMKFQGIRATAAYGTSNTLRASLSYYHKLSPRLGISYTLYYTHTDGYFTNRYNGEKCDKENQGSFRWKTVWRGSDRFTMENIASVQISRQGGYPYESLETGQIAYNDTCFYRRTGVTDGLTLRYRLDNMTLSSITSFQYIDDNMTLDQDFLPESYFTLTQARKEWAFTQDFVGKGNVGDYSWLGGVFGFFKHTDMNAPVTFKPTGIEKLILEHVNAHSSHLTVWDEDSFVLGSNFINPVWGVALYHQSGYRLGAWNFALGVRLDVEHTSLRYNSRCNTSFTITGIDNGQIPVDINDGGKLKKTFVEFLPKLTATYDIMSLPASNVYLSVARGYKAGGFNTQMFSDVLQQRLMGIMGIAQSYDIDRIISYKPETSWNYELGAHISDRSGRLSVQAALFYIHCRDQQLTMFPDGNTTGRIMTNAGKTRSYGAEITVKYNPSARMCVTASYGYTDARFTEFHNGINDYSGKFIPYAPHNTMFAGVSYILPVNTSWLKSLTLDVNCRGVGEIMWDEANLVKQPFYMLPGASVMMDFNKCSLTLWGENLSDTKYNTFYFVSIGNAFLQRGKPLRIGMTFRVQI